jgi:hypothetical protein
MYFGTKSYLKSNHKLQGKSKAYPNFFMLNATGQLVIFFLIKISPLESEGS